jgi:hypothetical protein
VTENPDSSQFQRDLANCQGHIGNLYERMGKKSEALSACRAALAIDRSWSIPSPA